MKSLIDIYIYIIMNKEINKMFMYISRKKLTCESFIDAAYPDIANKVKEDKMNVNR